MTADPRVLGQTPHFPFNAASSCDLTAKKGYMTVDCMTATVFSVLDFAHPQAGAGSLVGVTIPAGKVLYGIRKFTVTSGDGIAYLSINP